MSLSYQLLRKPENDAFCAAIEAWRNTLISGAIWAIFTVLASYRQDTSDAECSGIRVLFAAS